MNNNLVMSFTLNPDKTVKALVNLSHLSSEADFEIEMQKLTLKSQYRAADVYRFEREVIHFPDYILHGVDREAIVQYWHGVPTAAFMPWFVAMQDPI